MAKAKPELHIASKGCEFPTRWTGIWFQKGVHPPIKIQKDIFSFRGKCLAADGHMFYIEDTKEKCFRCVVIYEKHPNVLQYRETFCDGYRSLSQACSIINADAPLYSLFRVDAEPVPCELRGPFTFTYNRGHGECQYPLSTIDSCTDDSHLLFRFQACADVLGTESSVEELTCTAVWKEGPAHYLVGKISTRKSYKQSFTDENAYRCFVFDYLTDKVVIQMSQSADATCDGLVSPWEGSRTMRLTKSKHPTSGCQFPSWVTSNHKWHTLDGKTTYTFLHKNNTFKVSNTYQDQGDTKFICIEHISNAANSTTLVTYSSSGCKNGYVCMTFFRRHKHIIEIQHGEPARSPQEACYSIFAEIGSPEFVTLVARSVSTSSCPQLVETNEIRVQVVKGVSSSLRPELCRDHTIKVSGCRSHDTLEFLISCASFTDVKSFHCHGSWEEDGRSFLVTGLRNTADKYCFVYWSKDKTTHLAGVHDTCRRNSEKILTENVTFNISSAGMCEALLSSQPTNVPPLATVILGILSLVILSCQPIR
ncbi:uncharacterized protein LOC129228562 [Uloborus diversus]|uniref:uncharacterized protein LOC129228562 n=1 Tax=Uloborus diversus TaxID=327109 RepID=UPI002409A38F|nr:uncharacterized protein LOC129228562 [Uloborus diversus]